MSQVAQVGTSTGLGMSERRDLWMVKPLLTLGVFLAFIVYTTARAIQKDYFLIGDFYADPATNIFPDSAKILSPMFSPLVLKSIFGRVPEWLVWASPAFFVLWGPGGFRFTCYYYRKAYYRAFAFDPWACSVGEFQGNRYKGETRLLLFQNLHRFFMYVAVIFIFILTWDAVEACIWPVAGGGHEFGMSVGTIVLGLNSMLLGGYTFGCHSLRHLVGGKVDCFSCEKLGQTRFQAWRIVSFFNGRHQEWAWVSLFFVAFADFYVWMVASEVWVDHRFF